MIAWRTMEGPILLTLLMLGLVLYVGLRPFWGNVNIPTLSLATNLDSGSEAGTTMRLAGPVANPVERVVLPPHSIWAE